MLLESLSQDGNTASDLNKRFVYVCVFSALLASASRRHHKHGRWIKLKLREDFILTARWRPRKLKSEERTHLFSDVLHILLQKYIYFLEYTSYRLSGQHTNQEQHSVLFITFKGVFNHLTGLSMLERHKYFWTWCNMSRENREKGLWCSLCLTRLKDLQQPECNAPHWTNNHPGWWTQQKIKPQQQTSDEAPRVIEVISLTFAWK